MQNIIIGLLLFALGLVILKRILFPNLGKKKFPVRWTVTLGLYKTPEEYEKALEAGGIKISEWARQILKKITCAQTLTVIHLGSATVAELGLPKGGTTVQLHAALRALGLELCPADACAALCLLLKDQSKDGTRWMAMEAIAALGDVLDVFIFGRENSFFYLGTDSGRPSSPWRPGVRVVFRIPAQVTQP